MIKNKYVKTLKTFTVVVMTTVGTLFMLTLVGLIAYDQIMK